MYLCGIEIWAGLTIVQYCFVIYLACAVLGYELEKGGRISNIKLLLNILRLWLIGISRKLYSKWLK